MSEAQGANEDDGFVLGGPKGLDSLLHASKSFLHRQRFHISASEFDGDQIFNDGFLTLRVLAVPTRVENECPIERIHKRAKSPPLRDSYDTVAYMCIVPNIPGKFDVAKAKALGLKPGPNYGRLVRGDTVALDDGRVIEPGDCVGNSAPHPAIVVSDLPSERHLDVFLTRSSGAWRDYVHRVAHVVVLSELDFGPRLREAFPNASIHTVKTNNLLANIDFHRFQHQLHAIHPAYQLPAFETNPTAIQPFAKVHLYPARGADPAADLVELPQEQSSGMLASSDEMRISFLGTAAAIPGKYRNVSGILLKTSGNSFVLMDCGEGSLGQLRRLYGDDYMCVVERLKVVCLSHIHADHHLGLFSFLLARPSNLAPLVIFAPEAFSTWINTYLTCLNVDLNVDFVSCSGEQTLAIDGGIDIHAFSVAHCSDSYGFRVRTDGKSIVYSGDTRPSDNLVKFAQNCSLLIHEATMPDDLPQEAVDRRHCTVSEAIQVFSRTNAAYCVLTHFTQRFAKTFPVDGAAARNILYASDLLSFTLSDLPSLCSIASILPVRADE